MAALVYPCYYLRVTPDKGSLPFALPGMQGSQAMANISLAEASRLRDKVARFQHTTKKLREKAGMTVTTVVEAAEVSGVALALGYYAGKRAKDGAGQLSIFGVPLDLGVGVAAHVLAIMGVGGAEEHFRAIGHGGLATYFSTMGFNTGKTGQLPKALSGDAPRSLPGASISGQSLTADDLARLATE